MEKKEAPKEKFVILEKQIAEGKTKKFQVRASTYEKYKKYYPEDRFKLVK